MRLRILHVLLPAVSLAGGALAVEPAIRLERAIEEDKPTVLATVTVSGAPLEGAGVRFEAERSFGAIRLGEETTLDDGTAAVPFPVGLPVDAAGALRIRAILTAPSAFSGREVIAELAPEVMRRADAEEFAAGIPLHRRLLDRALGERLVRLEVPAPLGGASPGPRRALWASRAPLGLIATFVVLFGGVWVTYFRVFLHLYLIRKGGRR